MDFRVKDMMIIETAWRHNEPLCKIMTTDFSPHHSEETKVIVDLEEMTASRPGCAAVYNVARDNL